MGLEVARRRSFWAPGSSTSRGTTPVVPCADMPSPPQKETTLHESRDALVRAVLAPCSLDLRADRPDRRDNLSTDLRLPDRPPRATRPVLLFLPGQWAERQAPLGHSDAGERQPTGDRPACPQASVTSKPPGGGGSAAPAAPRANMQRRCAGANGRRTRAFARAQCPRNARGPDARSPSEHMRDIAASTRGAADGARTCRAKSICFRRRIIGSH